MNLNKIFPFLFLFLFLIISCKNSAENKEKINTKMSKEEGAKNAEIKAIDEEISSSGQVASSLKYTLENGEFIVVHAHLSTKGEILKIDEEYNDGPRGNFGKNSFYFKGDKIFATREYFEDRSRVISGKDSASEFVERISYYDKNEKVEKTIEKRVDFEEEIESVNFVPVALHNLKMDRAKKVLDQKDEYKVTFQGFINSNAVNFLIVGSSGENAYTSAIRVDNEDDFIKTLLKDQRKYLNRKIEVAFENVTDQTGFQYQLYIQGKFVD